MPRPRRAGARRPRPVTHRADVPVPAHDRRRSVPPRPAARLRRRHARARPAGRRARAAPRLRAAGGAQVARRRLGECGRRRAGFGARSARRRPRRVRVLRPLPGSPGVPGLQRVRPDGPAVDRLVAGRPERLAGVDGAAADHDRAADARPGPGRAAADAGAARGRRQDIAAAGRGFGRRRRGPWHGDGAALPARDPARGVPARHAGRGAPAAGGRDRRDPRQRHAPRAVRVAHPPVHPVRSGAAASRSPSAWTRPPRTSTPGVRCGSAAASRSRCPAVKCGWRSSRACSRRTCCACVPPRVHGRPRAPVASSTRARPHVAAAATGIRLELDAPARLVLAESYNRGRRASCDGRDLGEPEVGAAFGTAWRVPASLPRRRRSRSRRTAG